MSTGLIVAAVVVFLLVDGAIFYFVFRSRRTADDYAAFPVPGETTVSLPAGKTKLSYQESYKASSTGDTIDFGVPSRLEVSVVSPAGEPLEIKGPGFRGMGSVLDTGKKWSRARVGTIDVGQPGAYTVTAGPELEGAIEPQIVVGK